MLEVFQSHNSRDFRQRYSGSYGYYTVPETGKKVLVYMAECGENEVVFLDENAARYTARADTGVEFEFIPVEKRLFVNSTQQLCLINRRPARMWSRGINGQNTIVTVLPRFGTPRLDFPYVKAAVAPLPSTLQVVNQLEAQTVTNAALSNLFGVADGRLFLYDQDIGSFSIQHREFRMDEKMFRQEVFDLVERNQLPYKVVVNV